MATSAEQQLQRAGGRGALAVVGCTYVAAWVVGLFVAPSVPDPDASDATINAFYRVPVVTARSCARSRAPSWQLYHGVP